MALIKHSKRTLRQPCRKCGALGLYWAHDTDTDTDTDTSGSYCTECGVGGKFTLINKDGSRHVCGQKPQEETAVPEEDPFAEPEKAAEPPAPAGQADTVQAALQTLLAALSPKVDRSEVEAMVKDAVDRVVYPTRTVVERANGDVKAIEGATHHKLSDVVTSLLAGEHVMMVGPAGTGKSTIAEQAAGALGLESYSISLSPQTPASQLLGYMQATGDYVSTLFRKAYEEGGVFHFDEVDNAHPSVLAVINAGLANGHMAFPDRMVKRHADFRAVASANTYGRGADRKYVGRQAIDAATLDRFSIETIEVDEALETQLCHSVGLESDQVDRVLRFVRKLRANAQKHGMHVVLSPRASVGMVRLLAAGRSWESAIEARVRRGLGDTEWHKLTGDKPVMITDLDMLDQVRQATAASYGEYDNTAIVRTLIARYGRVDINTLDHDAFWAVVRAHATPQ